MALTVKQINADASFLLSFEPIIPDSIADTVANRPFSILVDPWITGPSTIIHRRFSNTSRISPACISSLTEIPCPDLVIISQSKPDHCNEATLRQLPPRGTKTLILAEPAAARIIRSWKYFDNDKIVPLERWEDPRVTGKQSVLRFPVSPLHGGQAGEVTVAYIPQKHDLSGLHGAVGITYRAPTYGSIHEAPVLSLTPQTDAPISTAENIKPSVMIPTGDTFLLPPTPPISPTSPNVPISLRSVRSASTLLTTPANSLNDTQLRPATASQNERLLPPSPSGLSSRPISVIFSPHGIHWKHLAPFATSHLVAEAALPLTALLHCMDTISNPWWLGGEICTGVPSGAEIATKLGARVWVSAHDGEKNVRGLAAKLLKTRRWAMNEIEDVLDSKLGSPTIDRKAGHSTGQDTTTTSSASDRYRDPLYHTRLLRLGSGEGVIVTGTGEIWGNQADDIRAMATEKSCGTLQPDENNETAKTTSHGKRHLREEVGKHLRGALAFPKVKVQNAMAPKTVGICKSISTKELIMPSPKLIWERKDSSCRPGSAPGPNGSKCQLDPEEPDDGSCHTEGTTGPRCPLPDFVRLNAAFYAEYKESRRRSRVI